MKSTKITSKKNIPIFLAMVVVLVTTITLGVSAFADEFNNEINPEDIPPEGMSISEKLPKLVLSSTIELVHNQALVFGPDNKYHIMEHIGESPPAVSSIDWDTATGLYNELTTVNITSSVDNLDYTHITTVVPAIIKNIQSSGSVYLFLHQNSNLTINTGSTEVDGLNVYFFKAGPNANLDVSALHSAVNIEFEYESLSGVKITAKSTSAIEKERTATFYVGNRFISAEGDVYDFFSASGPYGLKVGNFPTPEEYPNGHIFLTNTTLNVTTNSGRAISTLNFDIRESKVTGIATSGEAGIHSEYINISKGSDVYGKAEKGFGVVSLDRDKVSSEFPRGSIYMNGGILYGEVEEGVGISTGTANFSDNVTGIAQKGIGILVNYFNATTSGNLETSTIKGVSYGSSTEHFQINGSIADSTGISSLSSFYVLGNTKIIGEAPKDIKDSVGISALIFDDRGEVSNGFYTLYGEVDFSATGDIGFKTTILSIEDRSRINIDANTAGVMLTGLRMTDSSVLNVNVSGEDSIGLRIMDYNKTDNYNTPPFAINDSEITVSAGTVGIDYLGNLQYTSELFIMDSNLSILSNSQNSGVGIRMELVGTVPEWSTTPRALKIVGSNITSESGGIGIILKNLTINIDPLGDGIITNPSLEAIGSETGLMMQGYTDTPITVADGKYTIKGVSKTVPPDKVGRKPAIYFLEEMPVLIKLASDTSIYEEYLTIATKPILVAQKYMTYANGMNSAGMGDGVWNDPLSWSYPEEKRVDLEATANEGLSSNSSGKNALIVGRMNLPMVESDDGKNNIYEIKMRSDINILNVTFDADGGLPEPAPLELGLGEIIIKPTDPTKLGHDFIGWSYPDKDTIWDFADPIGFEPMVLKAVWELASYNVTFDGNGQGEATANLPTPNPQSVLYTHFVIKPEKVPTREGYTFTKWTKNAEGTQDWVFATDTMAASDITLYAQWKITTYTVNYDSNQGEPKIQAKEYKFNDNITLPEKEPTKRLYRFDGWYKDKELSVIFDFATERMPAKDITVYGKWIRTHYEVFFKGNGANLATVPKTLAIKIGEVVDISSFQPGGLAEPVYNQNYFLGWKDDKEINITSNFIMPKNDVTLTAHWISGKNLITLSGTESVVGYKNEMTKAEVEAKFSALAEYKDFLGVLHKLDVHFLWNSTVLSLGGVEKASFYTTDRSGVKVYSDSTAFVYILNKEYITGQRFRSFIQYSRISENGSEWSVRAFKEIPDFVSKTIVRTVAPVTFYPNDLTTSILGTYHPYFLGRTTDYFGNVVELKITLEALIVPKDEAGEEEINQIINDTDYWIKVAETLHLSKRKESWVVDGDSYKSGAIKKETLKSTTLYDRIVVADPMGNNQMSAEVLQILREQKNSRLEVILNNLLWQFDSEDFSNQKYLPTGFYPLAFNTDSTKRLKEVGRNGSSMEFHFEMNSYWQGKATLNLKLNSNLEKSHTKNNLLYLFHYNDNTDELELIGKLNPSGNGWFNIKVGGVFKDYILMDHLPGSVPKGISTSTSSSSEDIGGNISYKITDLTNPLDDDVKKEIEENLSLSGKTIDQITFVSSNILEETKKNGSNVPVILGGSALGIAGVSSLIYFFVKRKKDDEEN